MYHSDFFIINSFSKQKKADIVSLVKNFVKRSSSCSEQELFDDFTKTIANNYNLGFSDNIWLKNFLDNELFIKDIKILIKKNLKVKIYKEKQKTYIEKQKLLVKNLKKDYLKKKQSYQKPTKKQIDYYVFLCKKYNLKQENLDDKSKLDLITMINNLLTQRISK